MKKKEFGRFASEYLIPKMPGFTVKGNLIFQIPVEHILRGFVFESSGFNAQSFSPEVFVQPLYVPSDGINMTLGKGFLGVWKFQPGDQVLADALLEEIQKDGLPFLEALGTAGEIARKVEILKNPKNHYVRQAAAYSLVWTSKDNEAIEKLEELAAMLIKMSSFQKWALDVHTEVMELKEILIKNPSEAREQLARWAEETRRKLDLPM